MSTTRAQSGRHKSFDRSSNRSRKARHLKQSTFEDEIRDLQIRSDQLLQSGVTSNRFENLPISNRTATGLKKSSFIEMTDIQAKAMPLALAGKDILGAARTGSGKTLAFLIPVLERLYRERWGATDGLGALILSPTRELAIQIFDVLRKIGLAHQFSAGLIIGGKDYKTERDRLTRMNILVATPGRLLQHMDQTVGFDAGNLQILVLDEADRCLDMGFENTLDAILENIPKEHRQTLLFSATQTKRVRDLARLSLSSPEYVALHDESSNTGRIPSNLQQHYMVVSLEQKLSVLFSFIRSHLKSKCLVFFSACREVQFVHETFRKLRPGVPLMCMHGKQKQAKRIDIFNSYTKSQHAVLFATDIAARGLDFPRVDWVIQVDAPEDADTYIHRVGRTARYTNKGNSLLFALPSEEKGLMTSLNNKGIAPELIKPKESKLHDISKQLQGFLFQDPQLKYLGQKAFISYVRSINLQRDKVIFDINNLPLDSFAESLGLPGAPKIKIVKEAQAAKRKAARVHALESTHDQDTSEDVLKSNDDRVRTKYDRMFERKNQGVLSSHYQGLIADDHEDGSKESSDEEISNVLKSPDFSSDDDRDNESEEEEGPRYRQTLLKASSDEGSEESGEENGEDEFITLKRVDHGLDENIHQGDLPLSKRKQLLGSSRKKAAAAGMRGLGEKMTFDEEGNAHRLYEVQDEETFRKSGDTRDAANAYMKRERELLQKRDVEDKERIREKRREKRLRQREREREDADEQSSGVAVLPEDTRDDGYETPDFHLIEDESDSDLSSDGERPAKKQKHLASSNEEELAMKLLA